MDKYILVIITAIIVAGISIMSYLYIDLNRNNANNVFLIATTTSLYQTGVLEDLLSSFKEKTGLATRFHVVAKGSGEVLRLLADGSICIGFTHAPQLEAKYIDEGKITRLAIFGYNEFVLVGPLNDPARVKESRDVIEAFEKIYEAGEKGVAVFVSRGDLSGTHLMESTIWRISGLNPENKPWYYKVSQGMIQALIMADNLNGYILTDEGTFTLMKKQGKLRSLEILLRDRDRLLNIYSMYLSKNKACDNPSIHYIASKLRDFLLTNGQIILREKYNGIINPVIGNEDILLNAWRKLASIHE